MKEIKWDTPIQLSKVYQFSLNDNTLPQPIDWDDVSGENKMRRFFSANNWHSRILAMSCSSGTAQGGVLFLYEEDANNPGQPVDAPTYVLKLTSTPERVLFAEYVLKTLGRAKIPKSLVVAMEWDELKDTYLNKLENELTNMSQAQFAAKLNSLTDDREKLLHIIFRQQLLTQSTQTDQDKMQTYNDSKTLLKDLAKRPDYLIIMKSFARDHMTPDPFTNAIDPFTNPVAGQTYSFVLGQSEGMLKWIQAHNLDPDNITIDSNSNDYIGRVLQNYNTDAEFWKYANNILVTKKAFSDPAIMRKVGRVLAADTLLGNSDRFEGALRGANFPNAFFFAKKYFDRQVKGKADNPIGVIDNVKITSLSG